MPHARRAVLQVPIIKTQARIDENLFDSSARSQFYLSGKIILHQRDRISAKFELIHLPDILSLDIANDRGGVVGRDHAEHLIRAVSAREIDNVCSRFETGTGDLR